MAEKEYIEREAIYKTIAKNVEVFDGTGSVIKGQCLEHILTSEPADVVEVVRCKDCMYYHSISKLKYCNKHIDCWGDGEIYTDEDDYCSYGERRSENESV